MQAATLFSPQSFVLSVAKLAAIGSPPEGHAYSGAKGKDLIDLPFSAMMNELYVHNSNQNHIILHLQTLLMPLMLSDRVDRLARSTSFYTRTLELCQPDPGAKDIQLE